MSVAISSAHIETIKAWSRSAEYNRIQMRRQVEVAAPGHYRVRLLGSDKWSECSVPPDFGAAEWLFVNPDDQPIVYWNRQKQSVVLID